MALSLMVFVLCSGAYLLVNDYEVLVVLRMIHGAAMGFGHTALNAGVFSLIPRSRRGEGAGYYTTANSLPQALGPLLGLQLSHVLGFDAVFVSATVIASAALVMGLLIQLPEISVRRQQLRYQFALKPEDIIDRQALPVAMVALLTSAAFGPVLTFLDSFSQSEGMENIASLYFLIFAATVLLTRLFIGRIQDRFGDNAALYPALVSFVVSLALLAGVPHEVGILLSAILAGVGNGAMLPVLQAIIASAVAAKRISIGISTLYIVADTGLGLSPLVMGLLVEISGYRLMFAVGAGLILAGLVLYWFLHGRYDVRQGYRRRPHS